MADIFNRKTDTFGGAFASDDATLTFPKLIGKDKKPIGADVGLLVQRLVMNYQQSVTRLYEVGRSSVYYVGGRTNGEIALDRVIGPKAINAAFYSTYGDICKAAGNMLNFSMSQGCGDTTTDAGATLVPLARRKVSYDCHFCVITTVGINVAAADMVINENTRILFSSLKYSV